jgi:hypothetical protein
MCCSGRGGCVLLVLVLVLVLVDDDIGTVGWKVK